MKKILWIAFICVAFSVIGIACKEEGEGIHWGGASPGDDLDEKPTAIDYHLHRSYEVDTTGVRERLSVADGMPLTYFIFAKLPGGMEQYLLDEFYMEVPDLDLDETDDDCYVIISIGREISDLAYNGFHDDFPSMANAEITFSEDYHDQMIYIYIMEKIFITSGQMGTATFYVMRGEEKVFWGHDVRDLYETKWEETGV